MLRTFPNFVDALKRLAKNDPERAQKLGVSPRTLTRYRAGQLPPPLDQMIDYPDLLSALLSDAQAAKSDPPHTS